MEYQDVINVVIGTLLSVLGWFARQLWDAVQNLKEDMKNLEVDLPSHYVRKEDLESRFDKFETMLTRIYDKLENKVDK
tara:strand:+ start:292 stop:525 length:234 start_codon:yes stop_codon:yes gene_type:complete